MLVSELFVVFCHGSVSEKLMKKVIFKMNLTVVSVMAINKNVIATIRY